MKEKTCGIFQVGLDDKPIHGSGESRPTLFEVWVLPCSPFLTLSVAIFFQPQNPGMTVATKLAIPGFQGFQFQSLIWNECLKLPCNLEFALWMQKPFLDCHSQEKTVVLETGGSGEQGKRTGKLNLFTAYEWVFFVLMQAVGPKTH